MDIWTEPVRGDIPPRGFEGKPGIDRARAYLYGLVLPPTSYHLVGSWLTQCGPGSAVVVFNASPWFAHANGYVDLAMQLQAAIHMAGMTVAEAWRVPVPRSLSYSQVRLASSRSTSFVARAEVVRTTERMAFCRATCEDSEGRLIAHAAGAVELQEVAEADRVPTPELQPVEPPRYTTPDPHDRPVPTELTTMFDRVRTQPAEAIRLLAEGREPPGPIGALLGFRCVAAAPGECAVEMRTSRWLRIFRHEVWPGYLAELGIVAGGLAASTLMDDETPGILSFDVQYLRSVSPDDRIIRCEATAERHGEFVSASGRLLDGSETVSRFSMYNIALPIQLRRGAGAARVHRRLVSVLFTDIVASTASAERMGDARWTDLLEQHHQIVRRCLDELEGREIKTTGDGFLATFESPTAALRCARAVRAGVRRLGIDTTAAVHTGEVEESRGDIAGVAVNVAARILGEASPGEVLASRTVRDLVSGSDLRFSDGRSQTVKGVSEPVELFVLQD